MRLRQLLSSFADKETDLRSQIMCFTDTDSDHGTAGVLWYMALCGI